MDYLNAKPLWIALQSDARFHLVPDVPSKLVERLRARTLDLGLLPVIEYFRNPDIDLVPGCGICADGPVQSVLLFLKRPIQEVRRVLLDTSSQTSVVLTRIILRDRYRLEPEYVCDRTDTSQWEDDPTVNAALVIGDAALQMRRTARFNALDLADEWRALTGLPFVFAAWLAHKDAPHWLHEALSVAAVHGLAQRKDIAAEYGPRLGLPADALENYLTHNIRYALGKREREGMREYACRAASIGSCELRSV